MRRYSVRQVLNLLKQDDWYIARTRGGHRQLHHPVKSGAVTVNGKESDVLGSVSSQQYMETSRMEIRL